jgi:xylan 1,4-beta-xylosidase
LHRLGENRISVDTDTAIITRRPDGTFVAAIWNLFLPEEVDGQAKNMTVVFKGLTGHRHRALVYRLDSAHGSVASTYDKLGRPPYPNPIELEQLRHAADLQAPESIALKNDEITIALPPQGLALLEIR